MRVPFGVNNLPNKQVNRIFFPASFSHEAYDKGTFYIPFACLKGPSNAMKITTIFPAGWHYISPRGRTAPLNASVPDGIPCRS